MMRNLWLGLLCCLACPVYAQVEVPDSVKKAVARYIAYKTDSLVQYKMDSLQKARVPKPAAPKKFKYNISLTGSLNEGNVNRRLLAFRSEFGWTGKTLEFDLHPRFSFGEQNGQLAEREPYMDALMNLFHRKRVYEFVAVNAEASHLRGINLRWLGGVGVGWHIIRKELVKLSLTNLVLYEGTDFITKQDIVLWRNSTRLKGQYNIFKNRLVLKHWFYVQPSLVSQNIRWNGIISAEFPIYKSLQFKVNYETVHESVVPEGRQNTDAVLTLGLGWSRK